MKLLKDNAVGLLFTAAAFVVAGALYGRMTDPVPTHWNIHGVADGFMPKPWGAFLLPLTMAGMLALFNVIRVVSPQTASIERFGRVYAIVMGALFAFFFVLTVAASLAATGAKVDISRVVVTAMGALFVVLGNFLGKVTRNYFVGIRTPWTLENSEVWHRTHRLGGKVFVAGGFAIALVALLGHPALAIPILVAVALIPVVYSYAIHRRLSDRSA